MNATEESIFNAALDKHNLVERAAYLNQACAGDSALRNRIDQLVSAYGEGEFLEVPVAGLDATSLPGDSTYIGAMVGPYKLHEQIGEGGMGLVYMAEQQRPVRRLVALKVVKPGMDSRQVIARFEAERQALAMMDHPNIAKIFDAGMVGQSTKSEARSTKRIQSTNQETPVGADSPVSDIGPSNLEFVSDFEFRASSFDSGRPYFVMELVRGIPINEFCDQKRLTVRQRLELFIQVCHAVQHAHQKGIIHRDLKPTNVLVTMHDSVAVPKVIDFGIAKALGQQLTDHTLLTGFAQMIGTPLYMSPEQADMSQFGVDTRSDVYSLGVMLYELLTGTTPFDKETLTKAGFEEMRRLIREEEPPKPSARISTLAAQALSTVSDHRSTDPRHISTTLRGELDWVVMKALEKDRARRYESASALAADLLRYLTGELVQACPPSAAYRFRKFATKNRAVFTTAAVMAASLLLGTVISVWQAVRATAAEAQANANEFKAKKAAEAETAQRQRAEKSERLAKDRLAESERQRRQAARNLQAAFEALDQMLQHIGDPELNNVPRVGPLRRKMLTDAVAFYKRIPIQASPTASERFRLARIWDNIAHTSWWVDDYEQAHDAFNTAVELASRLVEEQPSEIKFRSLLAAFHLNSGSFCRRQIYNYEEAERHFRSALRLYADLARDDPKQESWVTSQAQSLGYLADVLGEIGKKEEAIGYLNRALDLLEGAGPENRIVRAQVRYGLAQIYRFEPQNSDELFRRAIADFRSCLTGEAATASQRADFAHTLWASAVRSDFATRQPAEAEKMLDESISVLREVCGKIPARRSDAFDLIQSLQAQVDHFRNRAAGLQDRTDNEQAADLVSRGESLFQEALERQRQIVVQFALPVDKVRLVLMLQEQAEHLLTELSAEQPDDATALKLRADTLLTEAIQLCRALSAEFPDNAEYKSRLADLLKLQAQHFGQKDAAGQP